MPSAADTSLKSRIDRFVQDAPPWAAFVRPTRRECVAAIIPACLLVPLGSLANHLPGIGLSLLHPGALIAFGVVLAAGLLAALIFVGLGRHGYAPASALLAFVAIDFNFDVIDGIAAAIMAFALARWKGVLVLRLLWVIYSVVLVTALFSGAANRAFIEQSGSAQQPDRNLPPLIHVVLDEVGPDVTPPNGEYSTWTHAYSRYHTTRKSLPEMLDGFHDRLVERGYALEAWTSGYFDICRNDARCMNYWHDNVRDVIDEETSPRTVARLALYSWLRSGALSRNIANNVDRRVQASHFNPVTTLRALDEFSLRAQSLEPGEAITIHALLPHYPYAYDAGCKMLTPEQWVGRHTAFPLSERRDAYARQLTCLETRLRQIHRDDAIVIIHGDHGTRYFDSRDTSAGQSLWAEQMRQAFSTVFLLHLPGVTPRSIDDPATISSLLNELADGDGRSRPRGRDENVWLGEHNFRKGEMVFE